MDTAIQMFQFQGKQEIRVVQGQDGDIWFVASDVCKALGIANVSDAVGRLDKDERDNIATIDVDGQVNMKTCARNPHHQWIADIDYCPYCAYTPEQRAEYLQASGGQS